MASHSFFLGGIDLAGVTLARVDERESIGTYSQLIEEVRARCGAEVASLFAEPIKGVNRATGVQNIAWYGDIEGTPFLLRQLDPTARQPVVDLLKQRLRSFSSVLGDQKSGALLGSWLYILSPDSIMAVSGQPVIKNWGMIPADFAGSDEARDTHFRNTMGLYLPSVPTPPFSEIEAQSFSGRMAQLAERETARAARPLPVEPMRGPQQAQPDAAAVAMSAPAVHGQPSWIAPAVACGVAALFLLLFLFGNILRYPAHDRVPDTATIEAQRRINLALRDRLEQLKHASIDVCAVPGSPEARKVTELLPPSPTQTKITALEPGKPEQVRSLGSVLSSSTVLVVTSDGTGSGFYISDRNIVTNHHVVGNAVNVEVGNKALGTFIPAHVVAVGAGAEPGTQDIAVLEVAPKPNTTFLRIASTPEQLEQVTTAGYPGVLLQTILQGSTSMPEANFTQGSVGSRQIEAPGGVKTVSHTAQFGHGNSGGPLVDRGGCVVGINSWFEFDRTGPIVATTFFTSLDAWELRKFLKAKNINFTGSDTACTPVSGPTPAAPPRTAP